MATLEGIKVAILICDGFEEVELTKPRKALLDEGADPDIISSKELVLAWDKDHWSEEYSVAVHFEQADPEDYDALLLPGGVLNPDKLRTIPEAVAFVKHFMKKDKPVAAICHGPWTLIETGLLKGRNVTSYHSIKTDLINAGAKWKDQEVVIDNNLITSRSPKDIPAFNNAMVALFGKK
jgi:protease I